MHVQNGFGPKINHELTKKQNFPKMSNTAFMLIRCHMMDLGQKNKNVPVCFFTILLETQLTFFTMICVNMADLVEIVFLHTKSFISTQNSSQVFSRPSILGVYCFSCHLSILQSSKQCLLFGSYDASAQERARGIVSRLIRQGGPQKF